MPELSVVVPAFRERENIPALLQALEQALAGLDWETIVVVDDAYDGTEELVRERAQHDRRVRCLQRIGRRGLASACIEGMLASSAPYIDRKSTRLNSSHMSISYAVFCLKKKKERTTE